MAFARTSVIASAAGMSRNCSSGKTIPFARAMASSFVNLGRGVSRSFNPGGSELSSATSCSPGEGRNTERRTARINRCIDPFVIFLAQLVNRVIPPRVLTFLEELQKPMFEYQLDSDCKTNLHRTSNLPSIYLVRPRESQLRRC